MKQSSIITAEKVIKDELRKDPTRDIFPITLVKFLLNRKKIMSFFNRIQQPEIKTLPSYIDLYNIDCDACKNNPRKMLCRKHTSIQRVMDTHQACFDTDTGVFIYMNEIFMSDVYGSKLGIIYTPHTKLIQGQLTEYKVKKISTISTYPDDKIDFQSRVEVTSFSSNALMEMYIKCWFNDEFSLITIPGETNEDNDILFCLIPNK